MNKKAVKSLDEGLVWFKTQIDRYLDNSPDDNLHRLVYQAFDRYWSHFAKLPASSSGRYHHKMENLRPFGLVNHTLRTVWVVKELCKEELGYAGTNHKWRGDKKARTAVAAAFLHDLGKMDTFKGTHGANSVKLLEKIEETTPVVVQAMVRNHMHSWSPYKATDVWQRIVAYGDYIASREGVGLKEVTYLVLEGSE